MEDEATKNLETAAVISLDELVDALAPIGINAARKLILNDPRCPQALSINKRGNIFAGDAARRYLKQVASDGFPHYMGDGDDE